MHETWNPLIIKLPKEEDRTLPNSTPIGFLYAVAVLPLLSELKNTTHFSFPTSTYITW